MNKDLLEKERLMETLFEIEPIDEADYILKTCSSKLTKEQKAFIRKYNHNMIHDDSYYDSNEQMKHIEMIHSYIGITNDDWKEFDSYLHILPLHRIKNYFEENEVGISFDELTEEAKQCLVTMYRTLYDNIYNSAFNLLKLNKFIDSYKECHYHFETLLNCLKNDYTFQNNNY